MNGSCYRELNMVQILGHVVSLCFKDKYINCTYNCSWGICRSSEHKSHGGGENKPFQTCESSMMKRGHRSPSCHLPLARSFVKKTSAAVGWKHYAEAPFFAPNVANSCKPACVQAPQQHHPVITDYVICTVRQRQASVNLVCNWLSELTGLN